RAAPVHPNHRCRSCKRWHSSVLLASSHLQASLEPYSPKLFLTVHPALPLKRSATLSGYPDAAPLQFLRQNVTPGREPVDANAVTAGRTDDPAPRSVEEHGVLDVAPGHELRPSQCTSPVQPIGPDAEL